MDFELIDVELQNWKVQPGCGVWIDSEYPIGAILHPYESRKNMMCTLRVIQYIVVVWIDKSWLQNQHSCVQLVQAPLPTIYELELNATTETLRKNKYRLFVSRNCTRAVHQVSQWHQMLCVNTLSIPN